jgi:hypothetical protein
VLGGVPCSGRITLYQDGSIKSCELSRNHAFGALEIPAGWTVRLWEGVGTRLDRFEAKETLEVQGARCKGHFNHLHEDGVRLRKCTLDGSQEFDGKRFSSGTEV